MSTTEIFESVLLSAYGAYESGSDINDAVNRALAESGATEEQEHNVVSRLEQDGLVEGIFERNGNGRYALRLIDRLSGRGVESAQRLSGERSDFLAVALVPLTVEEQRAIEPLTQQLNALLTDPNFALSEHDELALRDLSSLIDLILKFNEPDRVVTRRTLVLLSRKCGEIAFSGSTWDGFKVMIDQVLGMMR